MRYLRWGGNGEAVQPEKGYSVENCLECAHAPTGSPQRQVHALLGGIDQCIVINSGKCAAKPSIINSIAIEAIINPITLFITNDVVLPNIFPTPNADRKIK